MAGNNRTTRTKNPSNPAPAPTLLAMKPSSWSELSRQFPDWCASRSDEPSGLHQQNGIQSYIGALRTTVPDWWKPNPRREIKFPDRNLVFGFVGLGNGRSELFSVSRSLETFRLSYNCGPDPKMLFVNTKCVPLTFLVELLRKACSETC